MFYIALSDKFGVQQIALIHYSTSNDLIEYIERNKCFIDIESLEISVIN